MRIKSIILSIIIGLSVCYVYADKPQAVLPSYAWSINEPLGLREESTIDTLFQNYHLRSVAAMAYPAYATTGNLGAEGLNLKYFDRKPTSDFFFQDALSAWMPNFYEQVF